MALAGEGRNGEKCAGASATGVLPLASSRERMEGGLAGGEGGGGAPPRAGLLAGGGDFGCRISITSNSNSSSDGDCGRR